MSFTAWLTAAGTFGLLAALVAWLIYRAGRKDVETERLKDEAKIGNAQKDALANQPHTDSELADKLRSGRF